MQIFAIAEWRATRPEAECVAQRVWHQESMIESKPNRIYYHKATRKSFANWILPRQAICRFASGSKSLDSKSLVVNRYWLRLLRSLSRRVLEHV